MDRRRDDSRAEPLSVGLHRVTSPGGLTDPDLAVTCPHASRLHDRPHDASSSRTPARWQAWTRQPGPAIFALREPARASEALTMSSEWLVTVKWRSLDKGVSCDDGC